MLNLKPYFDAAQAASAEVLRVANEIDAAFNLGTEEGVQQAMAMKSTLDDAEAKAEKAHALYASMTKAGSTGDVAAKFVPAGDKAKELAEGAKTMTRAEFDVLTPQEKHAFLFKNGGTLVDEVTE